MGDIVTDIGAKKRLVNFEDPGEAGAALMNRAHETRTLVDEDRLQMKDIAENQVTIMCVLAGMALSKHRATLLAKSRAKSVIGVHRMPMVGRVPS